MNKIIIAIVMTIFLLTPRLILSDVNFNLDAQGYSTQSNSTIGAWEDEMWQVAKVLFTQPSGDKLVWRLSSDMPDLSTLPIRGISIKPHLASLSSGSGSISVATIVPGASLPADFIVVEWHVAGQLRFGSSGL